MAKSLSDNISQAPNERQLRPFSHNPLAQLAAAFAAGIVFATHMRFANRYLVGLLVIATLATLLTTYAKRFSLAGLSLLMCFFLAGAVLTKTEHHIPENQLKNLISRKAVTSNETVEITGVIAGSVDFSRKGTHFSLHVANIRTSAQTLNCVGTVAFQTWFKNAIEEHNYRQLQLQSGAWISVRTKLDRTEQYRNPGVSTLNEYLDTKDIDAVAFLRGPNAILNVNAPQGFSLKRLLFCWREFLQKQIDAHFSHETAGVLAAALLGNRYNLSHAAAERFREGGTFHILVISGAHITFIGTVFLLLARRLTARRWLQLAASTTIVWLYTIAVGAEVSVVRAALMFSLVATGHLLFRQSSPLNSLGAASLFLLVWSPKDLYDPSLQLTFLSVFAILGLAVPILNRLEQIGRWRPSRNTPYPPVCSRGVRTLAEALFWSEDEWQSEQKKLNHSYRLLKTPAAQWLEQRHLQQMIRYLFAAMVVTVSVQMVLLPVQIVYFHRLSLSSLILNVVVGVLLAVLAAVALVALLCAQLSTSLAAPLITFANAIDWLMVHSIDPFLHVGIASLRIPEYSGSLRAVYFLYYAPVVLFAFSLDRWRPVKDRGRGSRQVQVVSWNREHKLKITSVMQVAMFVLLVWHPNSAPAADRKLRIDFLDVGQGDSALLTMPDGATLLVDGGGRPQFLDNASSSRRRTIGEMVVCEYLWHRGLDSIDYVLATHADADHMDGLNDVVKNFHVRGAFVGRTPQSDPSYAQLVQTLVAQRVPVHLVHSGDVLKFGDVEIEVLWPPAASYAAAQSGNNDSVVLRVRFGVQAFLLTGDIEKTTEMLLAQQDLRSDVLKVPHHGSRTSSTETFVSAVQPRLAVISVGEKSMFGHPHEEVVERWQAAGAEVLMTGRSGMISVTTDGKSLGVTKFVDK